VSPVWNIENKATYRLRCFHDMFVIMVYFVFVTLL
jgi:hypothetical protein